MESSITLTELTTIARDIASQADRPGALSRTVDLAAKLLPCNMVDIIQTGNDRLVPVVSTDTITSRQVAVIDGRALAAFDDGDSVSDSAATNCPASELPLSDRGRRLFAATGIRAEMTLVLRIEASGAYVLRFFSVEGDPWSPDDRTLAAAFVDVAGVAIDRVILGEANENLRRALDTNRLIGTAVGILMTAHRITDDRAFDLLRTCSQHSNRKLRVVADDVVLTGALPERTVMGRTN